MVETWQVFGLGRSMDRVGKGRVVFWKMSCGWERTGSAVLQEQQLWQHQALAVLPSQQHSETLYGKGFVFFPGFQPVLAMYAAWIAKYTLLGISHAEENEVFLHSVTESVMELRGVGAGPAPSARRTNVSGAVELTWRCILSWRFSTGHAGTILSYFPNGSAHCDYRREHAEWDSVHLRLKRGLTQWDLLFTEQPTQDKAK